VFKSSTALGLLSFTILWILWEMVALFHLYNVILLPPPTMFWKGLVEIATDGTWLSDLKYSGGRYFAGLLLGNILGIILGALSGRVSIVRKLIAPVLNYFRAVPAVALIPAAIVWFGIGETEKIFIVTWGCTFPVWLNTFIGMSEVEREYIWAARALGTSNMRMYPEVYLPRSLPYILAGTRVSIATGFFALTAAEMAGAYNGIAFRIFQSHEFFRTDIMLVSILTIGLIALLCDHLFVLGVRKFMPWSKRNSNGDS
jgi:ABC-type nitrate/sulfonate/bicarbonate transport system permease component